jgi:hypothetical protein
MAIFTSLNDFDSTWVDEANDNTIVHYTKFEDRTITLSFGDGFWAICLMNRNHIVDEPLDSPIYELVGFDQCLLLDQCVETLPEALKIASEYAQMAKIPTCHPWVTPSI